MKKYGKFLILILILILVVSGLYLNYDSVDNDVEVPNSSGLTINDPNLDKVDLNVLVIEINPIINSIKNIDLYPNNDGHPKVSEYFGQDANASLNEMISDLEYTSHGFLNINIIKEFLNEYPTYTSTVTLNNGLKSHRIDEETYISASKIDGTDRGEWWNLYDSNIFKDAIDDNYSFDYDYIIEKFNLIERRNNNEFDQVWLLTIDPALTYESIMVGNNPFWINGPGYVADCQNFPVVNVSISRRDANLHALGHGVEGIMSAAFHKSYFESTGYSGRGTYKYYLSSYNSYNKDTISISSIDDYNSLSLWDKFILNDYANSREFSSVGNIHFPFNSSGDYDYSNTNKVYTNWRDWLNYPNVSGNFVLDNNDAWLYNAGNDKLGKDDNKDPDRLYTRFWFYLMPHIDGYTEDGYLNNWWKYFYSLDFVTDIVDKNGTDITTSVSNYVLINCDLTYNSKKTESLSHILEGNNVNIENNDVLEFKNGYLYAVSVGESDVTLSYDGKKIVYHIKVVK